MKKTWISSAHRGFVQENMHENTLSAFLLAAQKGADMIETDARMTADGVLIANHDSEIKGVDQNGNSVCVRVCDTAYADVQKILLAPNDPHGPQGVPTLAAILHLAYFTGMQVNIDLKEGAKHAAEVARLVMAHGMGGRVVYATNGAGAPAILEILKIDPRARFIDKPSNYTKEALASVPDYPAHCFAYTGDFSDENIARIRANGTMLATISLTAENAPAAFRHHPDMAEYPHTSDFAAIDRMILEQVNPLDGTDR